MSTALKKLMALTVLLLLSSRGLSGQEFVLENPTDPAAASAAMFAGTDLVITDATGQRFTYVRRPDFDTVDQSFIGYFSPAANQYLRWPILGTGSMQIGRPQGGVLTWTPSRMQIRRVGNGFGPVGGFSPGSPMHAGVYPLGVNSICVAQIDLSGRLHYYIGHAGRWKHIAGEHPSGVLIPGAPLKLIADPGSQLPRVVTIGANGRVVQVSSGTGISDVPSPPGVTLVPGSQFEVAATAIGVSLFAADTKGRLWQFQLNGGPHRNIESKPTVLEPGLPIKALDGGIELFMIDRKGAIVVYSQDEKGNWYGPEFVDDEFVSAGYLSVWTHPGTTTREIAAVDSLGRLQVLEPKEGTWSRSTIPGVKLVPGTPITGFETAAGINLTAILPDGRWSEFFQAEGTWNQRILGHGFPDRAPLEFSKLGPMLFATDVTGRLIAAFWTGGEWRISVCVPTDFTGPGYLDTPQLISRRLITSGPIQPAKVNFVNTSSEEVIVRVRDSRIPGKVDEIRLNPGGTTQFRADRDAGGTLEEVFLVPGPLGPVQQVRQVPLPPRHFYDVVVFANRVTYQYIDRRKQRGPLPDFNATSEVSIGAFPLPPGNLLQDGTQLDVYQIAQSQQNPGAAGILTP